MSIIALLVLLAAIPVVVFLILGHRAVTMSAHGDHVAADPDAMTAYMDGWCVGDAPTHTLTIGSPPTADIIAAAARRGYTLTTQAGRTLVFARTR